MEIASEVQTIVEGPPANPDPNEPRYCYCNEVSYGEMVGCDNDNVRTPVHSLVLCQMPTPNIVVGSVRAVNGSIISVSDSLKSPMEPGTASSVALKWRASKAHVQ